MLAETVREAARRFGARPAIVAPAGWSLSYEDLDRVSDEVAGGLAREGIGPGDVVALLVPSSPDYVVAYAAAAKLGAITVGINPRLAPPERSAAIATVAPDFVLAQHGLTSDVVASSRVITLQVGDGADSVLPDLRAARPVPNARPSAEVTTIVLTSGTTGAPRGAVFGAAQLEAIAQIDTGGRWGGGGPMLVSTELVHIGFMTKLPWYLRSGARLHLLTKWRAADALRMISVERMTSVGGIAAQFALMLREPDFDRFDLSSVTTLVTGGGPSPPALVREARTR
ncbi:MAG TPA: AMP-binding protein, partial [Actinomycetota bacterium]|nr:AMP-binding protein [Actinomycetota bacterium]